MQRQTQRRHDVAQVARRQFPHRNQHRPAALPLPQADPVLHRIALPRRNLDQPAQRVLGQGKRTTLFQQARRLLQCSNLVRQGVAGHRCQHLKRVVPVRQRVLRRPQALIHRTQVDVRRQEVRLQPNRFQESAGGAIGVAGLLQHDAVVEVHGVKQRIAGMASDEVTVQGQGVMPLPRITQLLGDAEQFGHGGGRHLRPQPRRAMPCGSTGDGVLFPDASCASPCQASCLLAPRGSTAPINRGQSREDLLPKPWRGRAPSSHRRPSIQGQAAIEAVSAGKV